MIINGLGVLLLLALTGLFVFLAVRAFRPRRNFFKWFGGVFAVLLALVGVALSAVALIGFVNFYLPSVPAVADFSVAGTPEQVARGQHIAQAVCADCHSQNQSLPLSGGDDFGAEESGPPDGGHPCLQPDPRRAAGELV